MQVVSHDYWDKRCLTYAANIYSSQLRRGAQWTDIKRVISVSILGGKRDRQYSWNRPFKRHYKLCEAQSGEILEEGIELLQYSIMNFEEDEGPYPPAMADWVTFLTSAHEMTSDDVSSRIKEPGVLKAFEVATYQSFPEQVKKAYIDNVGEYEGYSIIKKSQNKDCRRVCSWL